jgi:predicted DNA-binding transcriptional regulator AlpA
MSDRLLTFPDLKARKGIPYCRVHLTRLEKDGLFPARRQLGANRVVWIESEIDEHLRNLPRGALPIVPNANGR